MQYEEPRNFSMRRTNVYVDEKNYVAESTDSYLVKSNAPISLENYQERVPPVLYSVTLVSKKFFSFDKSIASLIHGNGFSDP